MKPIYARQYPIRYLGMPSVFLAGPTPRGVGIAGWRKEALTFMETFPGAVFVPEDAAWGIESESYLDQIHWEWEALDAASTILFWIPRDLKTLPGFTTNVEFGLYVRHSHRVIAGAPDEAPKNDYLKELANRFHVPWYNNLRHACYSAETLAIRLFDNSV